MKRSALTLLPLVFLLPSLLGDWVKMDDFEDYELGTVGDAWHLYANTEAAYDYIIARTIVDPARPDNQVFELDPNVYSLGLNPFIGIVLDAQESTGWSIPDGSEAMFYYRLYHAGPSNNVHIGMFDDYQDEAGSDLTYTEEGYIDAPGVGWTTPDWFLRPSNRFGGLFDFRDGTRYVASDTFIMTSGWYEFWMLIRNGAGDSIEADDYAIWVKPLGEEMQQILIPETVDGNYTGVYWDTALFRDPTTKPLKYLMLALNIGNSADPVAGDPIYWDDFAIDNTATLDNPNLTTPPFAKLAEGNPVTWFGSVQGPDGWTNTKAMIGWAYTGLWERDEDGVEVDSGYVFAYDFGAWKYLTSYTPQVGYWMMSWPDPGEPGVEPPEATWHGYPLEVIEVPQVDGDGNPILDDQGNQIIGIKNDAHTGSFLGTIEVTYEPFVWSYHYNNWVYLTGTDYSGMTWVWVNR